VKGLTVEICRKNILIESFYICQQQQAGNMTSGGAARRVLLSINEQ